MEKDYSNIAPICQPVTPRRQAAKRHYGSHPYFTRRAWNVVQEYIKTFAPNQDDIVLDPYGGSGVTAIESLVLRRRAIQVDINPLANFICQQLAVAPVNLADIGEAFAELEREYEAEIIRLRHLEPAELERESIPYWYPRDVKLPNNADVETVEELFSRRQLIGLSTLFHHIQRIQDETTRELFRFCFSATLAKVNRTFVSARNRAETRGGATIFSIYRYHVPNNPVELDVWEQFTSRFKRLMAAKRETNSLIGEYYRPGDTIRIIKGSATRLSDFLAPESVDYVYTDPPYGAHIAYLDLSTMWNAWLGFSVTNEDRQVEVIQGGDVERSAEDYANLLRQSIFEMFRVLKHNRWLSIVFVHKDTSYWDVIVESAQEAGFEYSNTTAQPVGVVWSMHKKKNPLTVLSGELVLSFRKVRRPTRIVRIDTRNDTARLIKNCAELTIVRNDGASTEQVYYDLVPALLESGLLGEASQEVGDIIALLREEFEFDEARQVWVLRPNVKLGTFVPLRERVRFYVASFLRSAARQNQSATFEEIVRNVEPNLVNGEAPTQEFILREVREVAHSFDGKHWRLRTSADEGSPDQLELPLT